MLRVVVAPDKFKWSLSASEAAGAMANGVRAACATADVVEIPMADGGEGTVEALVASNPEIPASAFDWDAKAISKRIYDAKAKERPAETPARTPARTPEKGG